MDQENQVAGSRVTVTDVDISFTSMVWLLIKLAFALIPAAVIVGGISWLVFVLLTKAP